MIPSLTELIELFTPKRESYEDIVRSQKNEELKRYCHNKELGFYPVELTKLPRFYQHINKFIEGRATRDLPDEQFDGLREYNGFRSLIEVGGIIGYNRREGLSELSYSVSELDQVEWIVPLPTDPTKYMD